MGRREGQLRLLFQKSGATVSDKSISRLNKITLINSKRYRDTEEIYRQLGGILDSTPCNLVPWDMEVNDMAVELDEERHFNRYRLITLSSGLYTLLPSFPLDEYRYYCKEYEYACLKSASFGGYWTNKSCEKQFGKASEPGDLNGNGSPRWKQRAFYDYLRDISPLIIGMRLARISIWETLLVEDAEVTVAEILDSQIMKASGALLRLIEKRSCGY
jgi:hypothetical protein